MTRNGKYIQLHIQLSIFGFVFNTNGFKTLKGYLL